MADPIDAFKRATRKKKPAQGLEPVTQRNNGLSSGCALLNLACTGTPDACFLPGKYYYLVGDPQSGKAWLSMTCFAEAQLNPAFREHRLIYDGSEDGALMDLRKYFGDRVADRIETADTGGLVSVQLEDFYANFADVVADGRPFLYVLDSMDALVAHAEAEKTEQRHKATRSRRAGKDVKMPGDFGLSKAKMNSAEMRNVVASLRDRAKQSVLIVISQTRDAVGSFFGGKTRAGGNALEFYSAAQFWTSIRKRFKRKVRDRDRHIGNLVQVKVSRSRHTGREATVEVPLYWSSGIDDIGGNVRYLVTEGHWKRSKGTGVSAPEFDFRGSEEALCQKIDREVRQKELVALVFNVWEEIRKGLQVERSRRYE